MDVEKYRRLFLEESRDHLQGMNRELLRLEREMDNFDGVDTLFREAHSVKGMAGSMGYESMVALSHAMEDLFDGIRKKSLRVSREIVSLLFEAVDLLGQQTDEVEEKGETSLDVTGLVERMRGVLQAPPEETPLSVPAGEGSVGQDEEADLPVAEIIEAVELEFSEPREPEGEAGLSVTDAERAKILDYLRQGKTTYACRVSISEDTASLTARNFVVLGRLNRAGVVVRSEPSLVEVMEGKGMNVLEALVATEKSESDMSSLLNSIPEVTAIEIQRYTPDRAAAREVAGQRRGRKRATEKTALLREDASRRLIERYLPKKSTTVRVDTGVLDDLINIVGELIITRDRLLDIGRDFGEGALALSIDRLDLLVRSFQETIMSVRMMPLEIVTDRFPRIVRDLARIGGKEIGFDILGQGIELDRAILEELNDVLIHLVRNAIDHGVEPVEERRKAGKVERAMVRLSAGRQRDWVWIAVEDDGRGMDAERIKRSAVERGLISPEKAALLDVTESLLLSCLPGLSTAETVNDVSGRGVGMDVVRTKVESFGGSLEIESYPGVGTKTTLHLPLTLAIVQVLLVELDDHVFGLPVSHIMHTVRVQPEDIERSQQRAMIRWGDQVVPLSDLGSIIGLSGRSLGNGEPVHAVLTDQGGHLAGLAVDRLMGSYDAVIKPLGLPLKLIPGLAGATVMGDGRTVLVLDVKTLVSDRSAPTGGEER